MCELIFNGTLKNKDEAIKKQCLLNWLKTEGMEVFNSFTMSEEDAKSTKKIFDKFEEYFEPKTNFRIERFKLQHFKQETGESVDSFMARAKVQAQKCKYTDDELSANLIELLILKSTSKKVQKTLLQKDATLTLDQAIDVARTNEATINHMNSLGASAASAETNIDAIRMEANKPYYKGRKYKNRPPQKECENCGLKHGPKCPAEKDRCSLYKQRGDWRRKCPNESDYESKSSDDEEERRKPKKGHKKGSKKIACIEESEDENRDEIIYSQDYEPYNKREPLILQ